MFNVEMTVIPAASSSSHVLAALRVPGAGDVRMGELVDEHDLRRPREDRIDVHLLERRALVLDHLPRDDLEVADLLRGARTAVRLDEADDDVRAAALAAPALVEHRERLADAGCGAEVDAERAGLHRDSVTERPEGCSSC